jgi:tetratricopeptide repeat protein
MVARSIFPLCLVGILLLAVAHAADDSSPWIGQKVMPKEDCKIRAGDQVLELKRFRIPYVVQKVDGSRFWVGDGLKGWVESKDVVPLADAVAYYTEVIRLKPGSEWAFRQRAAGWKEKGDLDNAIKDETEAIRLDPTVSNSHNNRGNTFNKKGEYDKAIQDFAEAIRLDPNNSLPYNNRASLWATCRDEKFRDGKRAVESATKACELTKWKDARAVSTLAAANAESGDFDAAIHWEEKAISLTTDDKSLSIQKKNLALFKDHKPVRN